MIWTYKEKKKSSWEKWFAWYKVPIGKFPLKNGMKIVWLQWVERKFIDCREGSKSYEYRLSCDSKIKKPGCTCQECNNKFTVDILVSDELWEEIKPVNKPKGGLLCGNCIMKKIEKRQKNTYILKEIT
jgi:hypothetical protein